MGIIARIFGGRSFVYRLDLGNGFTKKRVKEDDNFIKFKDQGTIYLVLKTVPPLIDKNGNRHFFFYETDVHTFNLETGVVLSEVLEKEFKTRLKLNEIQKFKDMMKDIEEEAIKDRAEIILESWSIGEEKDKKKKAKDPEFEITPPIIKLSQTAEHQIDVLTPHDTINEVMSMILDGKVLSALMSSVDYNRWFILMFMITGSALTIIMAIVIALMFPEQWAGLIGS